MKRRILFILICTAVIALVGFATTTLHSTEKAKAAPAETVYRVQHTHQKKPDPAGTVDGATKPEMIPNRVAYMLLFRFISNHRENEAKEKQIREYVRGIGLGKQHRCPPHIAPDDCSLPNVGSGDSDIDALIGVSESFQQRVSILDAQAKNIKDRTWPNPGPEVWEQLTLLQQQKEILTDEIIASLPSRLSAGGLERVIKHINQRVKHLTKKFPGPSSLPNGPGWQEHQPKHHP